MKRYRRGKHGLLNGSEAENKGKTDIPTPAREQDRLREVFDETARVIKDDFDAVAIPAQEEYRGALAEAREVLAATLDPRARKLFDKHGFAQDYRDIPSEKGGERIHSVSKAQYDLARAQARLNLYSVLTPAILERERRFAEARAKYPKHRWKRGSGNGNGQ